MVNLTGAEVWRKYNIQGVPASGAHAPDKDEIISWSAWLEAMLGAGAAGLAYATLTALNADLAHPANTGATVYNDGSSSGFYVKVGASGAGSWTRIGDLPTSVVRLTVSGGTANAILASAPETPLAPGNKLYLLTPNANNTAATTIGVNGGAIAEIHNALGSQLAANSLVANLPVLMAWQTDHYQLLISLPVDATGVLTDVLAARDAAAASAAALGNQVHQYDTRAQAIAATIPVGVQAVKVTRYATGYPLSYATYVPGTSAGPAAFQEAGGHWWELDLSGGVVDPRWFGAKGDGVADDTTALQAALTRALGGKRLLVPAGTFGVSATLDGGAGNVSVSGLGKSRSVLQVLGSSVVDPLLKFTDASDVTVEDCDLRGNANTVTVGAINFLVTAGSNVIGNNIVRRNAFSNFKAQYWIRLLTNVLSTSHTRRMRYVRIQDNDWVAATSLAPDFTSVGVPAMMIGIQGSVENSGSYVDDVIVSGNFADCSGVKGFITCWAGSKNVEIVDNIVLNAGALGLNDRGCYAMLAYNNHATADPAYAPIDITVSRNTIAAARSMGVYGASATRLRVMQNSISAVQDTTAGSLPYGAISLGQCDDSKANFNELNDNYVSIQAIPTPTSVTMEIVGNKIRSSVAAAIGVRSTVVGSFANKIKIANNQILLTGAGALGIGAYSVGAGYEYDKLDIFNNRVSSGGTGIACSDSSGGGIRANGVVLQDNHVEGPLAVVAVDLSGAVAKTTLRGGSINLANAGAACVGLNVSSAANMNIDGLQIANRATGSALAYSASSAKGTIRNVNFVSVARANLPADGSGHLGFQAPSGVPATGISAFVQNLGTTYYTPSAGYTIDGWVSDGSSWNAKKSAA